jgi:hypothetical protein
MKTIEDKKVVERLFVSCYGGQFDIGGDKVWDTWQIEGPEMVWYFRGYPTSTAISIWRSSRPGQDDVSHPLRPSAPHHSAAFCFPTR